MKIKKCTLLFLAFILLLSNTGMAFRVHYCRGKVVSVSSVYAIDECCKTHTKKIEKPSCAENKQNHSKCCDDELISLHDPSDTVIVKAFSFDLDPFLFTEVWKSLFLLTDVITVFNSFIVYFFNSNAPPLFKLYCQYTLYA